MILVIGRNGQLAQAFQTVLLSFKSSYGSAQYLGRDELQSIDGEIFSRLKRLQPSLIINTAAYTAVDKAETDRDACFLLNVTLPKILAEYCAQASTPLVHYSTDYVYAGVGTTPHVESDPTAPLNYYGETKLRGEMEINSSGSKFLIFRTSWVFSSVGVNFVKSMLRLGAEKDTLSIVSDQWGAPTFADDLALATLQILEKQKNSWRSGIYHLANAGETNWYHFAEKIFANATNQQALKIKLLKPIPSSEFPTPARRPVNSRLSMAKVARDFGIQMRPWDVALMQMLFDQRI